MLLSQRSFCRSIPVCKNLRSNDWRGKVAISAGRRDTIHTSLRKYDRYLINRHLWSPPPFSRSSGLHKHNPVGVNYRCSESLQLYKQLFSNVDGIFIHLKPSLFRKSNLYDLNMRNVVPVRESHSKVLSKANSVVRNPKFFEIMDLKSEARKKLKKSIDSLKKKRTLLTPNMKEEIKLWKSRNAFKENLEKTKKKLLAAEGERLKTIEGFTEKTNSTRIPLIPQEKVNFQTNNEKKELISDNKKESIDSKNELENESTLEDPVAILRKKQDRMVLKMLRTQPNWYQKSFKDLVKEKESKQFQEKFFIQPHNIKIDTVQYTNSSNMLLENEPKVENETGIQSSSTHHYYPSGVLNKPEFIMKQFSHNEPIVDVDDKNAVLIEETPKEDETIENSTVMSNKDLQTSEEDNSGVDSKYLPSNVESTKQISTDATFQGEVNRLIASVPDKDIIQSKHFVNHKQSKEDELALNNIFQNAITVSVDDKSLHDSLKNDFSEKNVHQNPNKNADGCKIPAEKSTNIDGESCQTLADLKILPHKYDYKHDSCQGRLKIKHDVSDKPNYDDKSQLHSHNKSEETKSKEIYNFSKVRTITKPCPNTNNHSSTKKMNTLCPATLKTGEKPPSIKESKRTHSVKETQDPHYNTKLNWKDYLYLIPYDRLKTKKHMRVLHNKNSVMTSGNGLYKTLRHLLYNVGSSQTLTQPSKEVPLLNGAFAIRNFIVKKMYNLITSILSVIRTYGALAYFNNLFLVNYVSGVKITSARNWLHELNLTRSFGQSQQKSLIKKEKSNSTPPTSSNKQSDASKLKINHDDSQTNDMLASLRALYRECVDVKCYRHPFPFRPLNEKKPSEKKNVETNKEIPDSTQLLRQKTLANIENMPSNVKHTFSLKKLPETCTKKKKYQLKENREKIEAYNGQEKINLGNLKKNVSREKSVLVSGMKIKPSKSARENDQPPFGEHERKVTETNNKYYPDSVSQKRTTDSSPKEFWVYLKRKQAQYNKKYA